MNSRLLGSPVLKNAAVPRRPTSRTLISMTWSHGFDFCSRCCLGDCPPLAAQNNYLSAPEDLVVELPFCALRRSAVVLWWSRVVPCGHVHCFRPSSRPLLRPLLRSLPRPLPCLSIRMARRRQQSPHCSSAARGFIIPEQRKFEAPLPMSKCCRNQSSLPAAVEGLAYGGH